MVCPWYAGHTMRSVCSIRFGFARPGHANTCQDCSYSYQLTDSGNHRPDLRSRWCTLVFLWCMISRIRRPSPVLLPIAPLRACCCKHDTTNSVGLAASCLGFTTTLLQTGAVLLWW